MDRYFGEIRLVSFLPVQGGWMKCDGSTLKIKDYKELYKVIGNQFGGDGINTFLLPDLSKAVPINTVKPSEDNNMFYCICVSGILPNID